jgi:hypothetical protein
MPTPESPVVESRDTAHANVGVPFEHLVRAANHPVEFTATGLPDGLSIDAATGIVSGTPAVTGEFAVQVGAANATGTDTQTLALDVGSPPPSPWAYGDIGDHVVDERMLGAYSVVTIRTPGITGYDAETGALTVRGAGSDVNVINQGMTVHLAHVAVEGDTTILARAADWADAASAGRAGVIMTKSLSPFDQMAATILTGAGAQFFRRPRVAFRPTTTDGAAADAPVWLRLRREGTTFSAATSDDGETWTPVGDPDDIPTFGDAPFYAGLAVVSGDPEALSTAVFDGVSLTPRFAVETVGVEVHGAFEHRVSTATPADFEAEALPPGLSIDGATGLISGTPSALGTFEVTITATNAAGSATGTVTIAVGLESPTTYATVERYLIVYGESGVLNEGERRRLDAFLSTAERFADRGQDGRAREALDRCAEAVAGIADDDAREVLLAALEVLREG